jgi:hypothetical protein
MGRREYYLNCFVFIKKIGELKTFIIKSFSLSHEMNIFFIKHAQINQSLKYMVMS